MKRSFTGNSYGFKRFRIDATNITVAASSTNQQGTNDITLNDWTDLANAIVFFDQIRVLDAQIEVWVDRLPAAGDVGHAFVTQLPDGGSLNSTLGEILEKTDSPLIHMTPSSSATKPIKKLNIKLQPEFKQFRMIEAIDTEEVLVRIGKALVSHNLAAGLTPYRIFVTGHAEFK